MSAETNPFEHESQDQPTSRRMGRGEFLKVLGGGLAGSLLVPKGALAAADTLASMERAKPLAGPPGIEIIYDTDQQDLESGQASAMASHRWVGGGLVLRPGKNANSVDLTRSPSAYGQRDSMLPHYDHSQAKYGGVYTALLEPFIVNFKVKTTNGGWQERTYAMVFNDDRAADRWNYLDLAWAKHNGALGAFAKKGHKPHLVKQRPDGPDTLPTFNQTTSGIDYAADPATLVYLNALMQEQDIPTVPSRALPPILTKV